MHAERKGAEGCEAPISDYSFSQLTLEQLFIEIVNRAEEEEEAEESFWILIFISFSHINSLILSVVLYTFFHH